MTNVYAGTRKGFRCRVTVNDELLSPRYDLRNHSPDGFEWGYNGSGPSQLALAILANEYGDKVATEYYQEFREEVEARIINDNWTLYTPAIDEIMANIADLDMGSEEAQNAELLDH